MTDPFSQQFWAENNDLGHDLHGDPDVDHPPICASCGVTMLPSAALSDDFSCQNDECEAGDG